MSLAVLTRRPAWTSVALIALHAVFLVWSAATNSVTFDEFAHLPAGAAYWRHADFSIFDLSPPLLRLVAASPPTLAGADAPPTADVDERAPKDRHWVYGQQFERANADRYQSLFVLGRLALIPISCAGAYLVYRWVRAIHGPPAGLAACAMYCFSPNVLAHAALVTTDVGTMVATLAATYAWWRFCQRPTAPRVALAALLIAFAQLCKFTSLLLFPAMFLIAAWELRTAAHRRTWRRLAAGFAATALFSLLTINACYLFKGTGTPLSAYDLRSATVTSAGRLLGHLPIPLPHAYVEGFDAQKFEAEGTHQGFLLGEAYDGARWYFYPVAIAAKTPLAMLALAGLALFTLVRHTPKLADGEVVCLLAAAVFLSGTLLLAQLNIGIRYLLPAYPFAYILISRLWAIPRVSLARARAVLLSLAILEPIALLRSPDFLPFVNVAFGGPPNGWRVVNDSNFDWGQDLIRLKRWMDDNGVESVHLGVFGRVDPAIYGIRYTPLNRPSASPYVVVSSYYLAGLAHRLPSADGPGPFTHIPFHAELARRRPVAVVGRTLYVYDRRTVADAMAEHQNAGATVRP